MKNEPFLKKYLPRNLMGRSILILILPIVLIQTIVSIIFIDRLYGDVTIAKTTDLSREINFIMSSSDPIERQLRAKHLDIQIKPNDNSTESQVDSLGIFDISGNYVIDTLRAKIEHIQFIDLSTNDKVVVIHFSPVENNLRIEAPRIRASARNPHQLLVATTLASILLVTIAFLILRNQIKPISVLAKSADAFGKGQNFSFTPTGATEVRKAGIAFLSMQNRIERQIEQRTLMLSGVSHDLKTPLTRMKLSLSLMDQSDEIQELSNDISEMQHIVEEFLAFTKDESTEVVDRVDIVKMAKSIVRDRKRMGHKIELKFEHIPNVKKEVKMRATSMRRALNNLLSNSKKYAENTLLSVRIGESNILFCVEDDGMGIPKADRNRAVKAFERLDRSRNQDKGSGSGLGLAITRDIVRSHGGTMELGHSTKLGGLKVSILLPR